MTSFPGKRLTQRLSSGLSVLIVLTVLVSLGSAMAVYAADGPTVSTVTSSQDNPLDIPGSFKDLPDAKDPVTAKRATQLIEPIAAMNPAAVGLAVDAEKVAAPFNRSAARTTSVRQETAPVATVDDLELVDFHATAYCLKGRTASGISTRPGIIAADPSVLPMGTVVHLRAGEYTGTYTVLDTGGRIKGRRVDVYVPTHKEAMQFGRRQVKIKVIGRNSTKVDRASKTLEASLE